MSALVSASSSAEARKMRAQPIHPFSWTPVSTPRGDQGGERFTISEEPGMPGRARVSGSLTEEAGPVLLDAVARGVVLLDLSRVHRIDDSAARVLAALGPERCTLLGCPRWLVLSMGARLRPSEAREITASGGAHEGGLPASTNSTTTERAQAARSSLSASR